LRGWRWGEELLHRGEAEAWIRQETEKMREREVQACAAKQREDE
jgi:hypothetical protein